MDKITAIKGIKDILPEDTPTWNYVESIARQVFSVFGFLHNIHINIVR